MFAYILGNDIIEQNLQFEAESYDFECDNDDFDVAVARRLERFVFFFIFSFSKIDSTKVFIVCLHFRLRRRSGQRSGDSYNSLDFKTAPQSLQSPQSFQ